LPGPTQSTSSVDPPSHESTRIVRPRVAPRDSYLPMKQALRGRARCRKVTRLGDISGQPLDLSSRRDRRP
jgi:hypothetical protein